MIGVYLTIKYATLEVKLLELEKTL